MGMAKLGIAVNRPQIENYCQRWKIVELSFFGSALREDFDAESDVDVLVTFDSGAGWSLMDFGRAEEELTGILGRPVDLVERTALEASQNWIRKREIFDNAEQY